MPSRFGTGQHFLGAALLGVGLSGCASQQGESLRLSEELGRARADAAWQQAHAAELEARVLRLEQRTAVTAGVQRAEDRQLVSRLDRLLEMNARLLAQRSEASPPAVHATPTRAAKLSDEQQLRALVERLRGHAGSPHGGLTREQENALRVLTRPERQLDAENPWPGAFY